MRLNLVAIAATICPVLAFTGCGSITACPAHDLDVGAKVSPLPDEDAPDPMVRFRQPGDTWTYSIRRNQWDDRAMFVLVGRSIDVVESEPRLDPTGFDTFSVRSVSSFFTCEGVSNYSSTFREFLSQDESGVTSLHGFSLEDEFRDETAFIDKPAVGRVRTNPDYAIGATREVSFQYDSGRVVENAQTVEGVDRITVAAGIFDAFRVLRTQQSFDEDGATSTIQRNWIVPELTVSVLTHTLRRTEATDGTESVIEEVRELVESSVIAASRDPAAHQE